jgi:two-component system response regulator PilR (NtrC family)
MTPEKTDTPQSDDSPGFWVIGEEPRLNEIVNGVVAGTGTLVRALPSLPEPLEEVPPIRPDWLLADLGSKQVSADGLERFKKAHPACQLFLVAEPNAPVPAELGRLGVRHWFARPFDPADLKRVFRAALRSRRAELVRLRDRSQELTRFSRMIGQAPAFLEACDLARRAARSASTVILIEGETGTGKSLFARAIHRESPRSKEPFVEVDCATIPGQLLESELFGHEKGAFTHAQTAKPGLLELADAGTFFLDEIGETDPQVQAKILKFLDSGRYRRVGGIEQREVDVRLITATQKDLQAEMKEGRFRSDLFHRIHVICVRIPPIRERPGDARLILEHYLRIFALKQGRPELRWSEAALQRLIQHSWPGNVREIVNLCERAVLLVRDKQEIEPEDLSDNLNAEPVLRASRENGRLRVEIPDKTTFDELERAILENAIERADGNISHAAASLGIGRGQLRYRMARLGLTVAVEEARSRGKRRAS